MASVNISELGLVHWEYESPQYFQSFWFEKVDGNALRYWTKGKLHIVGAICAVYMLFIWLGPIWMKNRRAYKLDKFLAIWNFFLALFSLALVARMGPALIRTWMKPNGYYKSICSLEGLNYPTTFWGFLYPVSKVIELGDTVFIVLRKKPLIFLHWFHHFNMVWCATLLFVEGEPSVKFIVIINSLVHVFMYFYYCLRVLHIKLPPKVPMVLTSMQITQFVWGLIGQYQVVFQYVGKGLPCVRTTNGYIITTVFGFAYLYLFVKLFYESYITKSKRKMA